MSNQKNIVQILEKSEITVKEGKAKATGNDYRIVTQEAYIQVNTSAFPIRFEVSLKSDNDKDIYKSGYYTLNNHLSVDSYGSLVISRDYALLSVVNKK